MRLEAGEETTRDIARFCNVAHTTTLRLGGGS